MTQHDTFPDENEKAMHSFLFTVRLWPETLADGSTEWRGQVRRVINGETQYFRTWSALVSYFERMLSESMK